MAESGFTPRVFSPTRRGVVWTATALFTAFVALAFFRMSCSCDLNLYHYYARTAHTQSLPRLYQTSNVEYPPLAIGLIVMTERLSTHLPEPLIPFLGKANQDPSTDFARFKATYRLEMVVCTLVTWGVVLVLLRRHFPYESPVEWAERLLAFTLCLVPLGYVLLDRLDSGLVALIMVALMLLLSRMHYAWSFAVLAAAIAFKFVPIALAPVWLLASQPASSLAGLGSIRGWGRFLAGCCVRGAVLAGFLVAFCGPLWLCVGKASLNFFTYHAQRGIEFESNYAAVLTLLKHLGYPVRTSSGWGSADLDCSAAPLLTQLSACLVAFSLLAGALVLFLTLTRRSLAPPASTPKTDAPLVLGHVLWALLAFVLFNKAFPPQYVLWLAPLVAVVPLAGLYRRLFHMAFFGVAYLTMLIYPRHVGDVLGSPLLSNPSQTTGASAFGTGLLLVRLLLLVFLAAILASGLRRRTQRQQYTQNDSTLATYPRAA